MPKNESDRFDNYFQFEIGSISQTYLEENSTDFDDLPTIFEDLKVITPDDQYFNENKIILADDIPRETLSDEIELNEPTQQDEEKSSDIVAKGLEHDLAQQLITCNDLVACQGIVSKYHRKTGHHYELSKTALRILIRSEQPENIKKILSRHKVDEIIDRIIHTSTIQKKESDFDGHSHLINFRNCVLDTRTMTTFPHDPKYLFTSFIDADYQYSDDYDFNTTNFGEFLKVSMQGDRKKIDLMQEIFGYVISNYYLAKKWFALIGVPHSGKSTILDILRSLVGSDFTSAIPLHRLNERFLTAELFKKNLISAVNFTMEKFAILIH